MPTGDADPVVQLRGVSKRFPGAVAVKGVDLDVYPGEVHVIAGENGAGKSTLMKLMSQVERPMLKWSTPCLQTSSMRTS